MSSGERYLSIECQCGRNRTFRPSTTPQLFDEKGEARLDLLNRLRCSACGRAGRPKMVTLGWSFIKPGPAEIQSAP